MKERIKVGSHILVILAMALQGVPAWADDVVGQEGEGPVIEHDPVRVAVRGQPISLLAKVTPRVGAVKSVTLNYTLSRHSAPLKIVMSPTGMDLYSGTIPSTYLQRADTLYYYIEAVGEAEKWTETTWQAVSVKDPKLAEPAADEDVQVIRSSRDQTPAGEEGRNWGTIALIAGGAAGIVGAAIALSGGGGGGGGGSTGGGDTTTGAEDVAGTYSGNEIICSTPDGGSTTCETVAISLDISDSGSVSSESLAAGTSASGSLSGDRFSITVPASQVTPGADGDITFDGTVRSGNVAGSISGSATADGSMLSYSGTFTADRL